MTVELTSAEAKLLRVLLEDLIREMAQLPPMIGFNPPDSLELLSKLYEPVTDF